MMFARLRTWMAARLRGAASGARVAVLAGLSLALAGCYDQTVRVAFSPGGQADLKIDIDFSRDAKDVIAFMDALVQLSPEGAAIFGGGMCKMAEVMAAAVPDAGLAIKAEQVTEQDIVSCKITAPLGKSDEVADKLGLLFAAPADPARNKVLTISTAGVRRLRIEIDFSRSGDPREIMRKALVEAFAASNKRADLAAVDRVATTFVPAMISSGRMIDEKHGFTLAIDALRVIETNGERRGNSVVFRWSWLEFIRRQLKDQGIDNKVYYAVIEY